MTTGGLRLDRVEELRRRLRGTVVQPGDEGYDGARRCDEARRISRDGTYFNFGGFWEDGEDMLAESFGTNYPRIRDVKAKCDQENVFHYNLRIPVGR